MDKIEFCRFENEEHLFDRTYNGVPYWQMLRFIACEGVASDRIEKYDLKHQEMRSKTKAKFVFKVLAFSCKSIWNFSKLPVCDMVCFTDDPDTKKRFFSCWRMPEKINALSMKCLVDPDMLTWKDVHTFEVPYLKGQIDYYVHKMLKKMPRDEKEFTFLQGLEDKMKRRFGQSLSAQRMEQEIQHWIPLDNAYEKYAERFFDKVKCKAIAVVCYYQNQMYAFYRVAKRRDIKIIEFQHGVINNHEEYWFEDQRGVNNNTPDYFLAFGQQHIEWTKMLPATRAIPVGFPYQEMQIKKQANVLTEEKTVIIYPESCTEFENLLNEFSNMAAAEGYRILMKLHPLQATDPKLYYPLLSQNPHIEVITRQDKGIYYWLKLGKHHVMASTTVGFEAVAMPHANICIAENVPHEQTQPLLDWGVACGFSTAAQLMELVRHPLQSENGVLAEKRKALWQPNAKQNIQDFLLSF
ncbi:MAG: hypothetical protein DBY17_01855 [Oscillospiraceae bacterium]|nr:MAG: hypothetical protein DBY17_01855 [Oscillospiraceae bacterium]